MPYFQTGHFDAFSRRRSQSRRIPSQAEDRLESGSSALHIFDGTFPGLPNVYYGGLEVQFQGGNWSSKEDESSGDRSIERDAAGNLIEAEGPAGTLSFSYDRNNRLTSSSSPLGPVLYSHHPTGERKEVTYPGGIRTVEYEYDTARRIERVVTNTGTTRYQYDDGGNRAALHYPNGVSNGYSYDELNRIHGNMPLGKIQRCEALLILRRLAGKDSNIAK